MTDVAPEKDGDFFAGLPSVTRDFLKSITTEEILQFKNMVKLHESLDDRPKVLAWLKSAREEDIELLGEGLDLVRSGRTIGRFTKWLMLTIIGAVLLGSQFGDAISRVLVWVRGGK